MLGWVEVLKMGVTGDRAARAVATIERSGRAQAKLIDDLLDVSRVVGGRMRLDLCLVDVTPIVRAALDAIRPTAEAKGVRLEPRLESAGCTVAGDADRLQQIAWNLLSNAVKFTPEGGTVRIILARRRRDVRLVVEDTGRGIPADLVPFVFERFWQADAARSRRSSGLGLGLAIVRHLVELHGGEVAAASAGEGRGATFSVTLPLAPLRGHADRRPPRVDGVHVLLVDGDPGAHEPLRTILEAHGARVTAVDSVRHAREAAAADMPDVVVTDLDLPDDDGWTLVRDLTAEDDGVAAIALTGADRPGAPHALAAGFQARLRRPVAPDLLLAAVSQLAGRPRAG